MQTILSIDVSNETARAVVVNIDEENTVEILENHEQDLGTLFSKKVLCDLEEILVNDESTKAQDNNSELLDSAEITEAPIATPEEKLAALTQGFLELIGKVQAIWTTAIITIPSHDYISFNIDLPFADKKNLSRILNLEIQDLVPFETDDFLLSHKKIAAMNSTANGNTAGSPSKFDIHVGLIPKKIIKNVLTICKKVNFEPMIITNTASALASYYSLAPDYFEDESAIILEQDPHYYLLTCVDGIVRCDRALDRFSFISASPDNYSGVSDPDKNILLAIKLSLGSTERRYKKKISKIYYIGDYFNVADIQSVLGRTTAQFSGDDLLNSAEEESQVAVLASHMVRDNAPPPVLVNFRVHEFKYNLQFKEVMRGARYILPYLTFFFACFLVYLAGAYIVTSFEISRLNSGITNQMQKSLPGLNAPRGEEVKVLSEENKKLEDQLKDISTLSSLTPLDIVLEISKDLPNSMGVTISALRIKDTKIDLEGSAATYDTVDKVHKILKDNPLYSRVKKSDASGASTGAGTRTFSFEIWIKE